MLYLGLFLFLLNITLGLFTIAKKRTLESLFFGIFTFGVGLWALGIYATLASGTLFWGRTSFLGAIIGIGSLLLFSLVFPDNKTTSKKILFLLSLPTLLLSFNIYTDLLIKSVTVINNSITGTFGPLMSLYQFFAPLYIFGSIFIIFKKYRKAFSQERNKIGYVLLGILISMGIAVITNAILPLWFKIYSLNSVGPFFSICMVSLTTYAIIKHQFLDIKIVIQRGIIYSILLSSITATYLSFVFTLEYLFHQTNETVVFISALVTTLIGIFGVPPLQLFFQKITDRIFFKDKYNYAKVLDMLTEVLNKNIILETITNKTSELLVTHMKSESVTFSFKSDNKIKKIESILSIPIRSNKKNIGLLNLGAKRSGDPYTQEDVSLLKTFASQAAVAIEKASLYQQVKEYTKTLEQRIKDRTSDILKLQKEQEMMILEISHGLQTPLTIMKGELYLLKKQGVVSERVDVLDRSIDRISAFIYKMLSLAHVKKTEEADRMKEQNLSAILRGISLSFQNQMERDGIIFTQNIEENIIMLGKKDNLEELVSNLLENAIKYMSPDRVKKISLSLSQNTKQIRITVKDSGVGISEEHIHHIFERFYRVKNDSTKSIEGTGLGLVICKKIVELHKGTITVESTINIGTMFTIKFLK